MLILRPIIALVVTATFAVTGWAVFGYDSDTTDKLREHSVQLQEQAQELREKAASGASAEELQADAEELQDDAVDATQDVLDAAEDDVPAAAKGHLEDAQAQLDALDR